MPESVLASITRLPKLVTISLVPLHNPAVRSKLRNKIIGHPILIVMECRGSPERLIVLRYSVGTEWSQCPDSLIAASTLRNVFGIPGSLEMQTSFNSSTSAFRADKIALSLKYACCMASERFCIVSILI